MAHNQCQQVTNVTYSSTVDIYGWDSGDIVPLPGMLVCSVVQRQNVLLVRSLEMQLGWQDLYHMWWKAQLKVMVVMVCTKLSGIWLYTTLKKLEEQTFDIYKISQSGKNIRYLGVATWNFKSQYMVLRNTQEHQFYLATPKISSILTRLKNCTSKVCSCNFFFFF